jgi:NAD(P) transhydrogenase
VLGVHIIGEGASELVHIGQAVMILGGTVDYFIDTVFNYPTLAECYKVPPSTASAACNRYQWFQPSCPAAKPRMLPTHSPTQP